MLPCYIGTRNIRIANIVPPFIDCCQQYSLTPKHNSVRVLTFLFKVELFRLYLKQSIAIKYTQLSIYLYQVGALKGIVATCILLWLTYESLTEIRAHAPL